MDNYMEEDTLMKRLQCLECGNTGQFTVGAKEYHRYIINNTVDFISDVGFDDHDRNNDYCCCNCDSFKVEFKEDKLALLRACKMLLAKFEHDTQEGEAGWDAVVAAREAISDAERET